MFPPFPQESARHYCQKLISQIESGEVILKQVGRASLERKDQGVMIGSLVCWDKIEKRRIVLYAVSGNNKQLVSVTPANVKNIFVPSIVPSDKIDEALKENVVDAMIFGPFLIVNGKPLNIVGDPWGKAPRIAIAQRKDGVMMFLVIDGENYINGASLQDMIDILLRYGAYNAANLDGGQSTILVIDGKLHNNPPPAAKKQGGRYVVTGWGLIP